MEKTRFPRRVHAAAALALIAAAAPAHAQSFGLSPDKNVAILGAPSALEAIMAAQAGSGASRAMVMSARFDAPRAPVFAAALAIPRAYTADLSASPSRPDIFNSIAMPIAHSALDARWNRVAGAGVSGHAARFAASLRNRDERSRLEAVNSYVNARVTFTNDIHQYGVADRWSSANDTLARGRGDCEDYALAKLAMLRRAGFADRNLYFVVLKDLARRADHAVLVVRSSGRFLVLDSGTDRLNDSAAIRDYRPVLTFTAGQRFTHGYRRSFAPPVVLASYDAAPGRTAMSGQPSRPTSSR